MKLLHVCSEFFPLLKTGGLADVTGTLPAAQRQSKTNVRLLMPGFPALLAGIAGLKKIAECDTFAGHVTLLLGKYQGMPIYLIAAPHLYQRSGSPYHNLESKPYIDNYLRFALLGWMACELAKGIDKRWSANIVQAHDWHAGLTCAYLAANNYPARAVFTIHNLAYQGLFEARRFRELTLPDDFFNSEGLEFYGQISYLKAGLFYADQITTVSPTYALEITTPNFGGGMEGLLQLRFQQKRLSGVLNGIDQQVWDPAKDKLIRYHYHSQRLNGKALNKKVLQAELGLTSDSQALLFAAVSRLTMQKGLDLVLNILPELLKRGGHFVLLGSGDEALEQAFHAFSLDYPDQMHVRIGYSESLSHRVIAGVDVLMIPSRFEPCGLTQLYGLKYGTLPLVRETGGLADTVQDCSIENLHDGIATGFVFQRCTNADLLKAVRRAFTLWAQPKKWRQTQRNGMQQSHGWQNAVVDYQRIYKTILAR